MSVSYNTVLYINMSIYTKQFPLYWHVSIRTTRSFILTSHYTYKLFDCHVSIRTKSFIVTCQYTYNRYLYIDTCTTRLIPPYTYEFLCLSLNNQSAPFISVFPNFLLLNFSHTIRFFCHISSVTFLSPKISSSCWPLPSCLIFFFLVPHSEIFPKNLSSLILIILSRLIPRQTF